MFRIVIHSGKNQMARVNRQSTVPARGKGWLQRLGILATSLLLLPVALFSLAVFIMLFLAVVAATLTCGFWLYSRLQREKPRKVIESEVVQKDGQELRLSRGHPLGDDSPGDISSEA